MRIDVHAHFIPESCVDLDRQGGAGPAANRRDSLSDLDVRLRDMTERGVDMQLVSTPPWVANCDLATARRVNNATADAIAGGRDRLDRTRDRPTQRARGRGRRARTVREGARVPRRGRSSPTCGARTSTRADSGPSTARCRSSTPRCSCTRATHLAGPAQRFLLGEPHRQPHRHRRRGGLSHLRRRPRRKCPASSSSSPTAAARARCCADVGSTRGVSASWEQATIQRPPSEYFRLLYFDTLTHSVPALNYLVETAGVERVMLGSDYPFGMGDFTPPRTVEALPHASDADREAIYSGNAVRVFGLSDM